MPRLMPQRSLNWQQRPMHRRPWKRPLRGMTPTSPRFLRIGPMTTALYAGPQPLWHRTSKDIAMIEQFKVFISQQGQALAITLLASLFGGALLLRLI
jgi:hypothetical protein